MEWIIFEINKYFNNKFTFLKLYTIKYNKTLKECIITFLYPETKTLSDDDKNSINEFVVNILNLNAKVIVKYKKSFLDNDLIIRSFKDFIKKDFPSASGFIDVNNLTIEKNFNEILLTLKIDEEYLNYIDNEEFKIKAKSFLEKNFTTEFFINFEKSNITKDVVIKPKQTLKIKIPRFQVEIVKKIFGNNISPYPEYIKNNNQEKKSVILAGKIENFEKKSYEVKKGKNKGDKKNYYSFVLNDTTDKIDVRYFSSKTNENKMDKLINNTEIIAIGDIEKFNNKKIYYIKSISTCILPQKINLFQNLSDNYEVVNIQPYSMLSQENIFNKSYSYNEFILNNEFVVFDVETTGLNYEIDEIIEIGAVKIKKGIIVSKFQTLIKPKNPIPITATQINNITNEMVENSPSIEYALRDFFRYTRSCYLVGYNVSFDQKFILQGAKKIGLFFDNEFIDVLPLARNNFKLTRYKLIDVVKRLEITLDDAHRAFADALATAEVFLKLNSI